MYDSPRPNTVLLRGVGVFFFSFFNGGFQHLIRAAAPGSRDCKLVPCGPSVDAAGRMAPEACQSRESTASAHDTAHDSGHNLRCWSSPPYPLGQYAILECHLSISAPDYVHRRTWGPLVHIATTPYIFERGQQALLEPRVPVAAEIAPWSRGESKLLQYLLQTHCGQEKACSHFVR